MATCGDGKYTSADGPRARGDSGSIFGGPRKRSGSPRPGGCRKGQTSTTSERAG